jgi:rhodanese-related sulfurtransferase
MSIKRIKQWLGGYMLLFMLSCNIWAQKPANAPSVKSEEFDQKLEKLLKFSVPVLGVEALHNNPEEYIILDAREKEEFEVSHIAGAKWIGYDDPDFSELDLHSKNKPVVVYCSVGYRSEKMGEKLKEMGFSKVFNLYGSIFEWVNQGYPVVNEQGKQVSRVHTYNEKWSQWVNNPNIEKVY